MFGLLNATVRANFEKHLVGNIEKLPLPLRHLYADDPAASFNDLMKAIEFYHLKGVRYKLGH